MQNQNKKTTTAKQSTNAKKPITTPKELISMGQDLGEIFTNLSHIFAVMIATNNKVRDVLNSQIRYYSGGKVYITDTTDNGAE